MNVYTWDQKQSVGIWLSARLDSVLGCLFSMQIIHRKNRCKDSKILSVATEKSSFSVSFGYDIITISQLQATQLYLGQLSHIYTLISIHEKFCIVTSTASMFWWETHMDAGKILTVVKLRIEWRSRELKSKKTPPCGPLLGKRWTYNTRGDA